MKNTASSDKTATAKQNQAEKREIEKTEASTATAAQADAGQSLTGRAVFAVDTTAAGIVVRTAFLTEQGQVVDMPAVFPDLTYALGQIDQLRQIVLERFSQAAQVGIQVIAAQQNANANANANASASASAPETTSGAASAATQGEPASA